MEITGHDGCACLTQTVTLNNIFNAWYIGNVLNCNGDPFAFSFRCVGNVWNIAYNLGCGIANDITIQSCDPIHYIEAGIPVENTSGGCCDGTIDIEITE